MTLETWVSRFVAFEVQQDGCESGSKPFPARRAKKTIEPQAGRRFRGRFMAYDKRSVTHKRVLESPTASSIGYVMHSKWAQSVADLQKLCVAVRVTTRESASNIFEFCTASGSHGVLTDR